MRSQSEPYRTCRERREHIGTSRPFVATHQFSRFQSEADIDQDALAEPDL
jgi:hypothetical protein